MQIYDRNKRCILLLMAICNVCIAHAEIIDLEGLEKDVKEPNREIRLDITSTPSGALIVGYTKEGKFSSKEPIKIGKTPIHKTVTIPSDIDKFVVDSDNNARYEVNPGRVDVANNIDHIEAHFEITDLLPLARSEFNKLSSDARIELIHVIGLYNVALNSPSYLFDMKSSEANMALAEFNEKYPKVGDMELGKIIRKMRILMAFTVSVRMGMAGDYVHLLQAITTR